MDSNLENAVQYLKSLKHERSGINFYDHLKHIIDKILTEQPNNAIDIIEHISCSLKGVSKIVDDEDYLKIKDELFTERVKLFSFDEDEAAGEAGEEDIQSVIPNLSSIWKIWHESGLGLNAHEECLLSLSMKRLGDSQPVNKLRFWGKIFGLIKDYYIVEAEFKEGEMEDDSEEADNVSEEKDEVVEEKEEESDEEVDHLPKSDWKPPPLVPKEERGSGVNKYVYFVTNSLSDSWTKLPSCTPQQIQVARLIRKYFTGDLSAQIVSNPIFPGNESNYLRAQIARISAATHISPINYYIFDDEEDAADEDDMNARDNFNDNEEYEFGGEKTLCQAENWVHHTKCILQQGRCTFVNPFQRNEEFEDEEEEEQREHNENEDIEPEIGPPLLTQLSEDAFISNINPWILRTSSRTIKNCGVVVVKSNLWPGAISFAHGRRFENLYIGFGHKYPGEGYSPPLQPPTMREFENDLMEISDPTVEEEAAARAAQEAGDAEEIGEEEEEEEDD